MNSWSQAEISLKLVEYMIKKNSSLTKIQFHKTIEKCKKNLEEKCSSEQKLWNSIKKYSINNNEKTQLNNQNHNELLMKSTRKQIQLKESPDKGRFMVAGESLKTGDILLDEKPVAACLLPKQFAINCHNCFVR